MSGGRGRDLFASQGLRAKKSFGQCFLADDNVARIIAESATTPSGGTALEIGAGTGALTMRLVERATRVVAIERDRDLLPVLRQLLSEGIDEGRVEVVEHDAMQADWPALVRSGPHPHGLAGNIPYQITGRIIHRAIDWAGVFDRVVLMVQREVANRLCATPETKEYGALSVFARSAYVVSVRLKVPASCFRPRPQVDSSVVVMEPVGQGAPSATFAQLVQLAFQQRRKTLRKAWGEGFDAGVLGRCAERSGVQLDRRGESLTVEEFAKMAREVEEEMQGLGVP